MKLKISLLLCVSLILSMAKVKAHTATWTDGIACIIYSHCTNCHNNNGIAPFSLMTYNDVYQNRFSVAASVQALSMPPFPPNQDKRKYAHANTLAQHEIDEIVDWVNNFAPLGNASQVPTPPTYSNNFQLTNADKVLKIPTYTVNTVNDLYRCFVLPLNNANQEFIERIEVVPGNLDIVHHALVFQDTSLIPLNLDLADPLPGYSAFGSTGSPTSRLVFGYTPGQGVFDFGPGFGARVNPNSYIVLQIHYPGGVSNQIDSTQVRIKYGSSTLRNISTNAILNHTSTLTNGPLVILPNQVKTFYSQFSIQANATITGIMPHMHLLGKTIKSFFVAPNGDTTFLVDIPQWDFHWQGFYQFQKPILVPSGSMLYGEATYDNTVNNPYNPNTPPDTVFQGEGTTDEMFLIYFNYTAYQPGDTNIIIDTASHFVHDVSCDNVTGVASHSNQTHIELIPNPASDKVLIKGLHNEYSITLFNTSGQALLQRKIKNNESISMQDLPSGTYYVQLVSATNEVIYKKWIRQ